MSYARATYVSSRKMLYEKWLILDVARSLTTRPSTRMLLASFGSLSKRHTSTSLSAYADASVMQRLAVNAFDSNPNSVPVCRLGLSIVACAWVTSSNQPVCNQCVGQSSSNFRVATKVHSGGSSGRSALHQKLAATATAFGSLGITAGATGVRFAM